MSLERGRGLPAPLNVFVLCTGRCGSRTLARALSHAENWTVGHETRVRNLHDRLEYPAGHVEVDNRLAFFLGPLAEKYPEALWVHLTRNTNDTAKSFARTSWSGRRGVMPAFTERIVWANKPNRLVASRVYVETQNANIREFLKTRSRVHIPLEQPFEPFRVLWSLMDAVGDLEAAQAELRSR